MYYDCHKCDWEGGQALLSRSGEHIKVTCPKCNAFIKFVKQSDMDHADFDELHKCEYSDTSSDYEVLRQIDFKLNLILGHFDIKTYTMS